MAGPSSRLRCVPDSPKRADADPESIEHALRFFDLIWAVVGNDLPREVHERVVGPLDRLGDPAEYGEETGRRVHRMMDVREGLLAAQYHRNNIERIERELVRRVRETYPEGSVPPGGSASSRMPVVAHEYVAYLLAARRPPDYLAQAVSACFGGGCSASRTLRTTSRTARPRT